jgi:rhodanese-related sulfurtransferase
MSTANLPDTDTISVAQLRQLMLQDPLVRVLDVRTGGEFDGVHIPGSFNVPLDTLGEHATDLADIEHPVVLVCKSGARASQAHGKLTAAGKQSLHLLDGGIDAWEASGGEVVQGSSTTWALDRQVRFVAGSISLIAVVLSVLVPEAKWLAGAVGFGLAFSAATNTCAMGNVLARLPYNQSDKCDIAGVLDGLRAGV